MTKIIAELCQNHCGDFELLTKMIEECAAAGAEYCKIQSIDSNELTLRERFENGKLDDSGFVKIIKRPYAEEKKRLDKLNLSIEQQQLFADICNKNNIKPLTTVFTKKQVETYSKVNWGHNTVKIASYDCGSIPLMKKLIAVGVDNFIISTGATYDKEIERTCNFLKNQNIHYSLLHCVTIYPTKLVDGHMRRMNFLRNFCKNVGFSDHSSYEEDWLKLSLMSIINDSVFVERHFTSIDKSKTKDGKVSLNKSQLSELVHLTKKSKSELLKILNEKCTNLEIELMNGEENRSLSHEELLNRDYYKGRFASVCELGNYDYNWQD